ncbi:hypothetical protein SDC9_13443 [bioreactor metagenome]|jgi:probable DNA metabolism protein|uniref:DUF4130 domain-containing protein n=2 Tax=root TaxID=1 RepID=A0A652ZTJ3_9SPIR|nr:TIGR03915 family putative DNA repair protein [Spirochaetales bacterium]VBB39100.1 conserved hypothetical protein [uncultured Spirochaetota bacterium]
MNTEITYRRGFAGFLCAVDESLRRSPGGGTLPPIRSLEGSEGLFDEAQLVDTDRARAREFWNRLRRVSAPAAQTCFAAFCSDRRDKDGALFRGIARILGEGPRALEDLGDKDIAEVLAASRRTLGEAHKFCGLLRFRELADSSWYAAIKPDCDILPFIGEHFSNRFRIMRFIIHDPGRSAAILHQPGKPWRLVQGFSIREEGGGGISLPLSGREWEIREGWLRYFKSTALEPRRNLRLQASHMPKKYWDELPETQNAGTKLPL